MSSNGIVRINAAWTDGRAFIRRGLYLATFDSLHERGAQVGFWSGRETIAGTGSSARFPRAELPAALP